MLGEHTAAVLSARLGLDETHISELVDEGVVGIWEGDGSGGPSSRTG
jgi:hypothetical protein